MVSSWDQQDLFRRNRNYLFHNSYQGSCIFSNNFSSSTNSLSTPPTTVLPLFPTVPSIHNVSDASFVLYHHRAFGSPVLSTFLKAIRAGYLASIPRLTATIVLRNPPLSLATKKAIRTKKRRRRNPNPTWEMNKNISISVWSTCWYEFQRPPCL